MGRKPCCAKEGLNRGAWSAGEDKILINYIQTHGEGKWRDLPQRAGLQRCGKSCRLRWLNYLRPDIKRGNITEEEEELITKLHNLLGNRWSLIAGRLPGRTDNEIKNYWNTTLSKKVQGQQKKGCNTNHHELRSEKRSTKDNNSGDSEPGLKIERNEVIRTKAVRCTKVVVPKGLSSPMAQNNLVPNWVSYESPLSSSTPGGDDEAPDFLMDFDVYDLLISDAMNPNCYQADCHEREDDTAMSSSVLSRDHRATLHDDAQKDGTLHDVWRDDDSLQQQEPLDLKELASFLDPDGL
ncbi:hypothetical protein Ancab_027547 [Ancistrocladus abbreviatus]